MGGTDHQWSRHSVSTRRQHHEGALLDPAVEGSAELGFSESVVFWIGLTLLVCTVLYAIPRTAILGALLLTGYLGGATATQVRLEDPWFLFPVVLGALALTGLYLRDGRLRALIAPLGNRD